MERIKLAETTSGQQVRSFARSCSQAVSYTHLDVYKRQVLSMYDELLYAERAIRAGAHGYITKQEAPAKILAAIRHVLKGEIYWSEKAAVRVASKITRRSGSKNNFYEDILTDREIQVFEMIGIGKSTRQIAASLHIDTSTVETYRARIKDKLNFNDTSELLQQAIRWSNSPKM